MWLECKCYYSVYVIAVLMQLQCKFDYSVNVITMYIRLQCKGYNSVAVTKHKGSYYCEDVISV